MTDKRTIKLSKPVQAHGQEIGEINLRWPAAGDVIDCGYPVITLEGGDSARIDAQAVGKLISKLGDVPLSTVRTLSVHDFNACSEAIVLFFGELQAGTS